MITDYVSFLNGERCVKKVFLRFIIFERVYGNNAAEEEEGNAIFYDLNLELLTGVTYLIKQK